MRRRVGSSTAIIALGVILICCAAAFAAEEVKIDLNKATVEELKTLEGVGDAIAARIIEYREKAGPFVTIDDLMKVKGIGERVFAANRHRLTVSTPEKK